MRPSGQRVRTYDVPVAKRHELLRSDAGQIVGYYRDAPRSMHGVVARRQRGWLAMTGFDARRVEAIARDSKVEQWPYPRIFDALRGAGVEFYETDVATHTLVYSGEGGTYTETPPSGTLRLVPAPSFEQLGVRRAIARNQAKETTYPEFLEEIAGAGVHRYRVDMRARTVTYLGAAGEAYVEPVPPF